MSLYVIDDTQGNGGAMNGGWTLSLNNAAVPEPSSLAFGALGAAGCAGWYVRRRAKTRAAARA